MRPTALAPTLLALVAALAGAVPAAAQEISDADLEFFEGRVRPLLIARCYECHSSQAPRLRGALDLETRAGWMRGGLTGPALVPGDVEASLLVEAVRYQEEDLAMPPDGRLPQAEIDTLVEWVRRGAPDPRAGETTAAAHDDWSEREAHWAYQPMADPVLPRVRDGDWPARPLDRFVLARLEAAGLEPAPRADRRTLLRRASFALTGLPPSPEELAAFEADPAPGAWERQVERLLDAPEFGERFARHWLDLARYADSNGLDENLALGEAWRYRDWLARAFADDLPYDRFLTWQLAGDLLPEPADAGQLADQLIATGFLVLGPKMLAEQDKPKLVLDTVDEQLDVSARTFLGVTAGCARCHDHKFDPFSQADYTSLAGTFRSTASLANLDFVSRWNERPLASAADVSARAQAVALRDQAREREQQLRGQVEESVRAQLVGSSDAYLLAASAAAADVRVQQAEDFARGNLVVDKDQYGSPRDVIVRTGSEGLQFVEYDVELPQPSVLELSVRVAAAEKRPVRLLVGGELRDEAALDLVTGSWQPDGLQWVHVAALELPAGTSVLRFEREGAMPHLDALLFAPRDASAPDANLAGQVLSAWTARLAAGRDERVLGLWRAAAELQGEPFAEQYAQLAQTSRAALAAGELDWNPHVAALLRALPAESPRELAGRYQALFTAVLAAHRAREGDQPLADAGLEELRTFLLAPGGVLSSPGSEALAFAPVELRESLQAAEAESARLAEALPAAFERALAVADGEPIDQPLLARGSHLAPGEPQPRGVPPGFAALCGVAAPAVPEGASGRLELARWMTRPEHPLTARVMVNRVWRWCFGEGLVRSPSNFGLRGDLPSHPELLDRLARDFVAGGWSVKGLVRELLLSSTWQQSSEHDARAAQVDPENRLLWRQQRRRLDAESVRDGWLAVSGRLDRARGGSLLGLDNGAYVTNDQSADVARYDSPRRSLYLPVVRNAMYDLYTVFDYADASMTIPARPETVGAHQALFLLNSPLVRSCSEALAELVLQDSSDGQDGPVERLYARVLQRQPSESEHTQALAFVSAKLVEEHAPVAIEAAVEAAVDPLERSAWATLAQVLLVSNEFLYLD